MLWRVRVGLMDRPGALAQLAAACGGAGVDIRAVQVLPDGGEITDELVVEAPAELSREQVVEMARAAGGQAVCATQVGGAALEDQPTRYVRAVRAIIAEPSRFPEIVAHLFDADIEPGEAHQDVLEMSVGDHTTIQIRRDPPFTATERARAEALADLLGDALTARVPVAPAVPSGTGGFEPDYVTTGRVVAAVVAGHVAGRAEVTPPAADGEAWPVDLWVDPAWQRRGLGTRLLADVARAARAAGADEIVLTAPSESPAVLPMVLAAGMRGRIRVTGDTLTVRIALGDLRR
ncbi:GNAT family N-acetyltransferase [Nocardioides sp. zg-536]|uniref:GNAT family N-acetyltransferase n=1 Tax=Nocardioides faecalis TaxID=2803858 RepID=A0A939BVN2_9ACTN|nr:GNAT family N-acetyltransferase [Nocardioides faecalis]MBM9459732.1 GNAT family N-acetyltransferase [Nocardioides faecalis]MBS4753491.1 GNAT family N-acetyltransferase [Nocardioides faecalis]QVI58251.1 GNAT family N-acetyltransferase [Nocardioides faecalis]